MQSSKYPGLNPDGDYSYLTEANVLKQTDALAAKLKKYGYEYVNIDAGLVARQGLEARVDEYGRQKADPKRFPRGMKAVADHIHGKGLKAGIYLPVGLEKEAYGDGKTPDLERRRLHHRRHRLPRPAHDQRLGQRVQDRLLQPLRAEVHRLPGPVVRRAGATTSSSSTASVPAPSRAATNYDNVADVAAWQQGDRRHRPPDPPRTVLVPRHRTRRRLEAVLATAGASTPTSSATATPSSAGRTPSTTAGTTPPAWTRHAGPGGWNDLDSLNVGNGAMDGLTQAERQSYATLWAIAKSPLYTGDDLTRLDSYGLSLLTNDEVIAINQGAAPPARPAHPLRPPAGLGREEPRRQLHRRPVQPRPTHPPPSRADWATLGFTGKAAVRDLWNHEDLGTYQDRVTQALPAHGSRLFTVTPRGQRARLDRLRGRVARQHPRGNASVADCSACSGGKKVGNLYLGGKLTFNGHRRRRSRHLPDQDRLHQR